MVKKLKILFFTLSLFLVSIFLFACNKIQDENGDLNKNNEAEVVEGYMNIDETEEDGKTKTYDELIKENEAKKLKEINFGQYFETDNKKTTNIKWQILYEDKNKKEALVTTKYTLDYMEFHDKDEVCTWETSTIREFLNNDFYNTAFLEEEKSKIIRKTLDNTTIRDMRIEGGNETSDHIFLASVDEVEKYNITTPIYNQYVLQKIESKNDEKKREWWLRNNATIKENKIIYSEDKKYNYSGSIEEKQNLVEGIDYDGAKAYKKAKIVRPLMWIKYDAEKNDRLLNEASKENEPKEKLKIGKTASNVNFGVYQGENIDWAIVKKEGNKALLLSRYIIEALPYNENGEECTWETSSIRKFLNNDFYNAAFSEKEKSYISNTIDINIDNEQNGINGGYDTVDKIFILSSDEIIKYLHPYDFNNSDEYKKFQFAFETEYVKNKKETIRNNTNRWWVRVPGIDRLHAVTATMKKDFMNFDIDGSTVDDENIGIRPAIWVYFDENIKEESEALNKETKEEYTDDSRLSLAEDTKTVTIGRYFNDNADEKSPIVWQVVNKDEVNGTALLISESVIETGSFFDNIDNNDSKNKTNNINWENSRVRKWLNEDFYNIAFNDGEKNYFENYKGDKIFLLSKDDMYFYFNDIDSRAAKVTRYAKDKNVKTESNRYLKAPGGYYWLKNDNSEKDNLDIVISTGQFSKTKEYNIDATCENIGIRPAVLVKYKIGEVKLASTGKKGSDRTVFSDIFNKDVVFDTVAVTDNFRKKVNNDVFKTFGLYKDKLHAYKVETRKKDYRKEIWLHECKNDEKNSYKHPYYKGMGLELREIRFEYKVDENNLIDDINLLYINNYYSEDFKLVKNGILFTEDNFLEIIEDLCKGEYYKNKRKADSEEEKYKIFYNNFDQYALTDKYRKSHNLDDSILDKNRFKEIGDMIGTGKEMMGEKYYVSPMEIDPAKEKYEYYNEGILPIAFNFDTERIYYNIYFTYTDDYMLDIIKAEEVKKKQIKGGDYYYDEDAGEEW